MKTSEPDGVAGEALPSVGDLFDLKGQVAIVTGGSRGLGHQMVRAFAAAGADVIIASRKLDACEAVAREIRAMGRRALPLAVNASNWGEMDELFDTALSEFGKVTLVVNNAGMSPAMAAHDMSEAWFDKIVSLNFKGPYRLAARAARHMQLSGGGSIINISSSGALIPLPKVAAYSAAKAALNAMTVSLAREYGPDVRINAISVGPFLTDIANAWEPEARETADNSLQRPAQPHEIVTTALYLASPASSFTTGAIIRCDGGVG